MSVDSFIDDLLKNARTCTHTHTCNPPGPDSAHSHTCYHTHTQVLASEDDDHTTNVEGNSTSKSRRPSGNREAVRKYREKKKAHAAYLEEEVKKLRLVNQQLVRKLRRQAILDAEILKLRGLLVDVRGKMDSELGNFPFQKHCNTSSFFKEADCQVEPDVGAIGLQCQTDSPCFHPHIGSSSQFNTSIFFKEADCQVEPDVGGIGLQCQTDSPCFHPHIGSSSQINAVGVSGSWKVNCQPAMVDCRANGNEISSGEAQAMDATETLASSATQEE